MAIAAGASSRSLDRGRVGPRRGAVRAAGGHASENLGVWGRAPGEPQAATHDAVVTAIAAARSPWNNVQRLTWINVRRNNGTVTRVDMATNKGVATISCGLTGGGGEIAVGEGSVWVTLFEYPLTRIDPRTNQVMQQFYGPGGDAVRVGHGSVWLSNLRAQNLWRLDPRRIEAVRKRD